MAINAPQILQDNWPLLVVAGATRKCTYQETAGTVYVPSTGDAAITVLSSEPDIDILFDEFGFSANSAAVMINSDIPILSVDRKVIFPALDISVTPSINDRIIETVSGLKWRVIALSTDPMGAHHALHVRPVA